MSESPSTEAGASPLSAYRNRVPVGWFALTNDIGRTLVTTAGMVCVITFMYLQLGFSGAIANTATCITGRLDFDYALVSSRFLHLAEAGKVSTDRLLQVLGDPDVLSAKPFYYSMAYWRGAGMDKDSLVAVLGIEPVEPPSLVVPGIDARLLGAISHSRSVGVDRLAQKALGPIDVGTEPMIMSQTVQVVGQFELGVGFIGDGAVVMGDSAFSELTGIPLDQATIGLVKLKPGADIEKAGERLRQRLPRDTRVLSRDELADAQIAYWVDGTSIGRIFTIGAFMAFIVGIVVMYQVLSTDIINQIREYATLKAIGYGDRRLQFIVVEQAVLFCLLGLVPGYFAASGFYALIRNAAHLPLTMTVQRGVGVAVLCLLMCAASAIAASRKFTQADPADVF